MHFQFSLRSENLECVMSWEGERLDARWGKSSIIELLPCDELGRWEA